VIGRSLQWRLLIGAAIAILVALALAWAFMTLLFERHANRRLEAELTRDAIVLVAGLALDARGLPVSEHPPRDARLQTPAGGFYWQVRSARGALRSRSLWDADLSAAADVPRGEWRLRRAEGPFEEPVAILEREVVLGDGKVPLLVQLAEDTRPVRDARAEFARELAAFLAVLWLVLSAAAWGQVSLGLRPLRRIRGDLDALRANATARLPVAHLREIQPLADAINALADTRERELAQARRRAADLAHGLKTPLAALAAQSRRAREAGADEAAQGMERALAAIGATVDAELTRARVAAAQRGDTSDANVLAVVEALVTVLEHTDAGSRIAFGVDVADGLQVPIAADVLSEILGALLENAVRHARRQVRVSAVASSGRISISIEDDGPGIASEHREDVLMRGARLDESGSSGLGLAIARDLVAATAGDISLDGAVLGGLAVRVSWPRQP
jgi:signal transduction histidine kinase